MSASTNARNRRKGAHFELDVLDYVRGLGFEAERLRLAGRRDEGDLVVKDGGLVYVVEAKAAAKHDLAGWTGEAQTEAVNYALARGLEPGGPWGIAVIKRRMKPVSASFVVTTLAEFLGV